MVTRWEPERNLFGKYYPFTEVQLSEIMARRLPKEQAVDHMYCLITLKHLFGLYLVYFNTISTLGKNEWFWGDFQRAALSNIFTKANQVNVNKVIQSGNNSPYSSSLTHLLC